MDMAYSTYDPYNSQVGFPLSRRPSMYSHASSEYAYDPVMPGGPIYDSPVRTPRDKYSRHSRGYAYEEPQGYAASAPYPGRPYTPSRQMSQYNPG